MAESGSPEAPKRPKTHRSKITNGTRLLPSVHPQSVWARYMRDIYDSMMSHLGGSNYASEPRRLLARRIALLETELVHLEDEIGGERLKGCAPSGDRLDLYNRLASAQRRHLEAIGLDRTARELVPTLSSYIREIESQKAEKAEAEDVEADA